MEIMEMMLCAQPPEVADKGIRNRRREVFLSESGYDVISIYCRLRWTKNWLE